MPEEPDLSAEDEAALATVWAEPDRFVEPVEQEKPWSCGAAAMRAVLGHFGIDAEEATLREALDTTPQDGTSPQALVRLAKRVGLQATPVVEMTHQQVEQFLDSGKLILACVQAGPSTKLVNGHWIVMTGHGDAGIQFLDPQNGEAKTASWAATWDHWRDVGQDGRELVRLGLVVSRPETGEAFAERLEATYHIEQQRNQR